MDWNSVNQLRIPTPQNQQGDPFPTLFTASAANAYAVGSRAARGQDFLGEWNRQTRLATIWNETVQLFLEHDAGRAQRYSLHQLLEETVLHGRIKILDLNPQRIQMSSDFKLYLMDFVFKRLRQLTYIHYRDNTPGNCLIVLDEAGRYIPQDTGDNELLKRVCRKLTESVKEMRKMRCGFMFITQTVAEIQKEIFRNLHFRIYGVGLGVGVDADHIRSREGDDAYELYRSLPDPRLSNTYSFMVSGVLLALGSSGRPMVIEGFPSGEALLQANTHILQANRRPSLAGLQNL